MKKQKNWTERTNKVLRRRHTCSHSKIMLSKSGLQFVDKSARDKPRLYLFQPKPREDAHVYRGYEGLIPFLTKHRVN